MNYDGPALADALARARHRIERDEALLRQALKALESNQIRWKEKDEAVTALRERLGEACQNK